jgi:hypothetical protein
MPISAMDWVRGSEFWQDGCRTFIQATCAALHYAGEPITRETIVKFVQSIPRKPSELMEGEWRKGFCHGCLAKVYDKAEEHDRQQIMDYFLKYFPERSWVCQETLIDSVVGILEGIPWEEFQCITKG